MHFHKSQTFLASAAFAFTFATHAPAANFVPAELLPPDLIATSHFGRSVAAGGNMLGAGAFANNAPGAIYLYQRNSDSWIAQTELHAPNPAANDEFGLAVATDGTTLVAGGRADTYIFTNNK